MYLPSRRRFLRARRCIARRTLTIRPTIRRIRIRPRMCGWGDQTWEEMMIGWFDIAVPKDWDIREVLPEGPCPASASAGRGRRVERWRTRSVFHPASRRPSIGLWWSIYCGSCGGGTRCPWPIGWLAGRGFAGYGPRGKAAGLTTRGFAWLIFRKIRAESPPERPAPRQIALPERGEFLPAAD